MLAADGAKRTTASPIKRALWYAAGCFRRLAELCCCFGFRRGRGRKAVSTQHKSVPCGGSTNERKDLRRDVSARFFNLT